MEVQWEFKASHDHYHRQMKDNTRSFAVKGYYLSICLSTVITNLSIPIEMQREDEVKEDLQVLRVLHDWL